VRTIGSNTTRRNSSVLAATRPLRMRIHSARDYPERKARIQIQHGRKMGIKDDDREQSHPAANEATTIPNSSTLVNARITSTCERVRVCVVCSCGGSISENKWV
jgi:hypothetical protein